jgi:hypothetical protein
MRIVRRHGRGAKSRGKEAEAVEPSGEVFVCHFLDADDVKIQFSEANSHTLQGAR